jgi:signal transduction histidine kinase
VRDAVPPGTGRLAAELDEVAIELGGVLDDLRELARGVHPAALADGGLRAALKTLGRRSAVPVRLDVWVDGRGGADRTGGSGLVGLADRGEALGGRLVTHSPRNSGTILRALLPLTPPGE